MITIDKVIEIDKSYNDFETGLDVNLILYQVYFDYSNDLIYTENGYFVAIFENLENIEEQCQNWIDENESLLTAVIKNKE